MDRINHAGTLSSTLPCLLVEPTSTCAWAEGRTSESGFKLRITGLLLTVGKRIVSLLSLCMRLRGSTARAARSAAARPSRWSTPVYVGPPDAVSNLRPVMYGATPVPEQQLAAPTSHPYSLAEFAMSPRMRYGSTSSPLAQYADSLLARLEAAQLHARLQTMWLDQFNQRFWTDNNTRFRQALEEYERQVSPGTTPPLEVVAPFYREWLSTNEKRLRLYNRALWLATYKVIIAQWSYVLRRSYTQAVTWLAGLRSPTSKK